MPTYLDHNATTPLDGGARQQIADLVNAHPGQVIFMNDATQAGNFSINDIAALGAQ
jgi:cysteine sulfinate desulfinase/cysteine desulfurase-like protein